MWQLSLEIAFDIASSIAVPLSWQIPRSIIFTLSVNPSLVVIYFKIDLNILLFESLILPTGKRSIPESTSSLPVERIPMFTIFLKTLML
jgi:hypothetical protein